MMNTLVIKYLDGELNEEETRRFIDMLETDKELDREVRALEELVDLGSQLEPTPASAEFTDRVMQQVRNQAPPRSKPLVKSSGLVFRRAYLMPLAASWALALGLGYFLSQGLPGVVGNEITPADNGHATLTAANPGQASVAGMKMVRLVYSPPNTNVARVRIAGSFNNWDPDKTPMHLENGHWVASLILPPNSYEYMFVVDDDTWVTDPLALTTRDDGFGSRNAVLELSL